MPDLMVDILSERTRKTDQITQRKLYERVSVPHYWIGSHLRCGPKLAAARHDRLESRDANETIGDACDAE